MCVNFEYIYFTANASITQSQKYMQVTLLSKALSKGSVVGLYVSLLA